MNICNYCGRSNEDAAEHCVACGSELLLCDVPDVPPELPLPKVIDPGALDQALAFENGFHRVDWERIRLWIHGHVDPMERQEAWDEAALLWVKRLRDDLGGNYFVLQSRYTVLLCDQPLPSARWLLDYVSGATTAIKEHLGETAWHGDVQKNVILVFSDLDDYYQYVSHHWIGDEHPASGGVCIYSGYTYIAAPWRDEMDVANAIVHELSHDCLAHLQPPVWLDEGVAVILQKAIAPSVRPMGQGEQSAVSSALIGWRPPVMWDELAERHFAFWNESNIQSFWAGTSFHKAGDSNELSYSLAEILVKLLTEHGQGFRKFLETARRDDAGQTAAFDILGVDLGDIAGTFLGGGNWHPQRTALVKCWEHAGWQKADGNSSTNEQS